MDTKTRVSFPGLSVRVKAETFYDTHKTDKQKTSKLSELKVDWSVENISRHVYEFLHPPPPPNQLIFLLDS